MVYGAMYTCYERQVLRISEQFLLCLEINTFLNWNDNILNIKILLQFCIIIIGVNILCCWTYLQFIVIGSNSIYTIRK